MRRTLVRPLAWGSFTAGTLLTVYFIVLTLISGWNFAQAQFNQFWYFIVSLAIGFGIQIGLWVYLKLTMYEYHKIAAAPVVAVTGTTSTVAMISCCTHYIANLIPLLGVAGALTLIAQYQVELFWIGIGFNLFGIWYLTKKLRQWNTIKV